MTTQSVGSHQHGPTVSVIIPAHDAQAWLAECLASVSAQDFGGELEIVVVDDGSRDNTAAIARAHAHVHAGTRCLQQPQRGPSAARNAGVAASSGEFIAFLDADDLWPEGKLAAQLQLLAAQPAAALVFGDCRQFDAQGPWPRTEFAAGGFGAAAWGSSGLVPDAYGALLTENFITTGSVVMRRSAWAAAGGFAEDLRLVEDLELWLRVARRQALAWCERVCLLRRRHGHNTSRDGEAMSLAFLEVLRRQAQGGTPVPALARHLADIQLRLAERALLSGRARLAARRTLAALADRPHPATVWQLARLLVRAAAGRSPLSSAHRSRRPGPP